MQEEEGAASAREGLGVGPELPRTLSLPPLGQLDLRAPSSYQEPSGCRLNRTLAQGKGSVRLTWDSVGENPHLPRVPQNWS